MSFHYTKRNYSKYYLIIFCFVGVLLNICINLFISKIGVPIYLDTIGTIFVAFLGGVLPAIIVCLLSSMIFNIVVPGYLYFSLINVIIAFLVNWFYRYSKHSKFLRTLYFILTTSIVCSSMGAVILAYVSSAPIGIAVKDISQLLNLEDAKSYTFALMVILFFLNIVDKGISLLVALLLYKIIPEGTRKDVSNDGWKQKPLSLAEIKEARNMNSRKAIHKNVAFILSTTILLLSLILIWISITFYYEDCKEEYTDEAFKVAESAATIVDGDEIYEYVKWGEKASGYNKLENELKMLLNNTQGVVKLSIFIPEQNGVLYLFQEAKEGAPIYDNGIVLPYMEEFSEYNDAFINLEVVDEIMFSKDRSIMTASYPIRNSSGEIVSYAVADVYMSFLWDYAREYLIKIFLCFSGFVVMILVFGFNQAGYELVLPINAITKAAGEFLDSHGDQKALDENVRKTRAIGINTGDEVEQLYKTICKWSLKWRNM